MNAGDRRFKKAERRWTVVLTGAALGGAYLAKKHGPTAVAYFSEKAQGARRPGAWRMPVMALMLFIASFGVLRLFTGDFHGLGDILGWSLLAYLVVAELRRTWLWLLSAAVFSLFASSLPGLGAVVSGLWVPVFVIALLVNLVTSLGPRPQPTPLAPVAYAQPAPAVDPYTAWLADQEQRIRAEWPAVSSAAGLWYQAKPEDLSGWQHAGRVVTAVQTGKPVPFPDLPPRIVRIEDTPRGVALTVQMGEDQVLRAYERAAEIIANNWHIIRADVEKVPQSNLVTITLVSRDVLREAVELTPESLPEVVSLKSVPVGSLSTGGTFYMPLDSASALYGGVPGSGKSSTMNAIMAALSPREDVQFYLIDCTSGPDFRSWEARAAAVAVHQGGGMAILRSLWSEVQRRRRIISESDEFSSISERGYDREMPMILLMIDEFPAFFCLDYPPKSEEFQQGQEALNLVTLMAEQGRKTGVFVHLATPQPTTDTIKSRLRNACQTRLCFRTVGGEMEKAVLGGYAGLAPISAAEIPFDQKGTAIAVDEGGALTVMRSYFSNKKANVAIAKQWSHFARPLPDLDPKALVEPWQLLAFGAEDS